MNRRNASYVPGEGMIRDAFIEAIREKFNTYRFADYKEKVIDLLLRVTTVSVRTVEITKAMEKAARS